LLSHAPTLPRIVARWVDGEAAAVEQRSGSGCIRTVAVDVPERGDLVLEPSLARFVAVLAEPCGGGAASAPLSAARRATLAGAGPGRAPSSAFATADSLPT